MDRLHREQIHNQDQSGQQAWDKVGIAISLGDLTSSIYLGDRFDKSLAVLVASDKQHMPAMWAYCSDEAFRLEVRKLDKKVIVANGTLIKVPFDLEHWQKVGAELYPAGLPQPYTDDPTQWIFHGHPKPSVDPLQVAMARLLGYTWPAESDEKMELSKEARAWIARCKALATHVDSDGIVCLSAVRGEKPAHERLLALLIDAWNTVEKGSWKPAVLDRLLADAECAGKSLEVWLRDKFFEQHARRFHHRPFIWHIWDGKKDGFSALVNYHKLNRRNLETLTYTYLGEWIRMQERDVKNDVDGAEGRADAAKELQQSLEAILEGEEPYDIFVRWKPLEEQPIGWEPDLNDGVRMNIRPFVEAGVLRVLPPKLNIKWEKDRGKDVESAPWYKVFKGERINDHHLSLEEKRKAREKARKR
jgi:hypothetical protein